MNRPKYASRRTKRGSTAAVRLCADLIPTVLFVIDDGRPRSEPPATAIRLKGRARRVAKVRWIRAIGLFAVAAFTSRPAAAQTANADITPTQLFVPERGDGVRIAPSFLLYPTVDLTAGYDTNIYNVDISKRSDEFAQLSPSLVLASDFSRHSVELRAGADFRRYAENTGEDAEAYRLDLKSTLELGEHINVVPEAGLSRGFEQRGTAGDLFQTDRPVVYNRRYVAVSVARERGILGLALNGRVTTLHYEDASIGGVPISMSDRDVTVRSGSAQASYRVHDGFAAFVEGGINAVDYRTAAARTRNSSGYTVLAGVRLQPSAMIDLEAGAGYLRQDFDDPAFAATSAINYRLSAKWIPRRNWAARAEVRRDVDPSPRSDVPAIIRSQFALGAQHSLGDRLLIEAEGASVQEDYQGLARSDQYYRVGLSARYRLNDRIGLTAGVGYRTQDGGRNFSGFSVGFGVKAVL